MDTRPNTTSDVPRRPAYRPTTCLMALVACGLLACAGDDADAGANGDAPGASPGVAASAAPTADGDADVVVSGGSEERSEGEGEHAEGGGERAEGDEHDGEEGHGEGEHDEEGEESGDYITVNEVWEDTRDGARLRLVYDPGYGNFVGSVRNDAERTLCAVRVEIHIEGGPELGPTEPRDLEPGQSTQLEIPVGNANPSRWNAHAEQSAC